MSFLYNLMRIFFKFVIKSFFRDIQVIGLENIPLNEPMILCGNHSNQFVDGMMIVGLFPREVSFIMAAKSVRRRVIGDLAKMIHVVPVERPQDLAKPGKGKISAIVNSILKGEGTDFTKQMKVGDSILLNTITAITSPTEAKVFSVDEEHPSYDKLDSSYKIIPKVDQSEMFDAVFNSLKANRCIGIFPEGGSHDRSDFLELKAGIAIMALGAMSKFGIRVNIVPIGLNYYKPSAFRSKVIIDVGKAYAIPNELTDLYKKSKREAITVLLREIENRMKDCHIVAPSYSELTSIFLVRNIYKPDKEELTAEKEQLLNRRFSEGYQKLKDHPEIVGMLGKIKSYYNDLKVLGIKDSEVLKYTTTFSADVLEIIRCLIIIMISFSFALPGVLLGGPFALLLQYLSEKERVKALAGSKVKISANDVVASYKIVCAFVVFPIMSMIYTTGFYLLMAAFVSSNGRYQVLLTFGFFLLWPIYAYIMFRSMDRVVRNWRTMKAKLSGLLFGNKYTALKKFRVEIQAKIRELVDKHGPEVFEDFEKKRVISKKELSNSRRSSWMLEEVFTILEEKGI